MQQLKRLRPTYWVMALSGHKTLTVKADVSAWLSCWSTELSQTAARLLAGSSSTPRLWVAETFLNYCTCTSQVSNAPRTRRFQACTVKKSRPCRGTFARANQADRCMNLLHCTQRSTPWLLDTRGCESKVECFSLFERYVTLPVGTWLIALEQSSRSQGRRLLRTSQSRYFVLHEKKETFSVVSLQLTVQLPCRNVFSSFILPLRACQKRSLHDVSTVGAGAERGVNNRQTNRSPQSLRSTKIRARLTQPTARPETSCGVLATLVV